VLRPRPGWHSLNGARDYWRLPGEPACEVCATTSAGGPGTGDPRLRPAWWYRVAGDDWRRPDGPTMGDAMDAAELDAAR